MAPLTPSLTHVCRPCLHQRALLYRTFTSSPSRRKGGTIPVFPPTPSAPLNTLLSTFRQNVFLPAHLIKQQTSLIYRPKNHKLLTNPDEPATAKVGNEVFQLHPLNHLHDEPNTRNGFTKVLELCGDEDESWKILPAFLEGLKGAKRRVRGKDVEKMIRRLAEGGRMNLVMEVVRKVDKTGVGLWDVGIVREVMLGCVVRVIRGEWIEEVVTKAAKEAEMVLLMMDEEKHAENVQRKGVKEVDPRVMPEIVGVVVQLLAAKCVMWGEGRDVTKEREKVLLYAARMLGMWENGNFEFTSWPQANLCLIRWTPVWHGIKLAQKVAGEKSDLGKRLGEKIDELDALLEQAKAMVQEHVPQEGQRRGLKMYEELSRTLS